MTSVRFGLLVFVAGAAAGPTQQQLALMDMGLSQFIHFSVNVFAGIEHNCVEGEHCIPASEFNPSKLDTDQWAQAAVAMGAGEMCLTAHHEGGFCLWPSQYTNYTVAQSPFGQDIVEKFVVSAKKYNLRVCYYIGPNANGYLNNANISSEEFIQRQLGMFTELLTTPKYGPVDRLWWDHYGSGCGGLAPCPKGSFPAAWPVFTDHVRKLSPNTIICPGPDCQGHIGESGEGSYPVNYTLDANGTMLPKETCVTPLGGWFCHHSCLTQTYWNATEYWVHYMKSVGIGYINTINAPPADTGLVPEIHLKEMTKFGDALRAFLVPLANLSAVSGPCSTPIELDFGSTKTFNAIQTRENLSENQIIKSYEMDFYANGMWSPIAGVLGQSVGARLIDILGSSITAEKIRFRCTSSLSPTIKLESLSVHTATPP